MRQAHGIGARRVFRITLLLLPIGVAGNIAYTFFATDRALLASLGELPRTYLLCALTLALTPWVTAMLRLWVWTRFLQYRIPARELVRMTLVVDLGSAASPTAIGGEAFKFGLLLRHGVKPGAAALLALLPKLEDGIFFAIALPLAIIWTRAWELPALVVTGRALSENALIVVGIAVIVALTSWVAGRSVLRGLAGQTARRTGLAWWARLRRKLRRTWREARAVFAVILRRGKTRFAATLSLTAVQWGARYSVISALALFLGVPFDPILFWLLQWVVFTIMSFVPTPGATGGAEVAFTAVYATLLPAGSIGVATAAWRTFTFYVPVALAAAVFPLLAPRDSQTARPHVNVTA